MTVDDGGRHRAVLAHLGVPGAARLGAGTEAVVYDGGGGTVVKVYRAAGEATLLGFERRRAFAARLETRALPFAVPVVLRTGRVGGIAFAVERTLPGRPLAAVLPGLPPAERESALRAFLAATEALGRVELPGEGFGELLTPVPVREATWPDFLRRKTEQALRAAWPHLTADAGEAPVRGAAGYLERELPRVADVPVARLVHGDYFAENVLVAPTEGDWAVTGVTDFSDLTLAGDPRLDVASAVLFVEELPDYRPADTRVLVDAAVARHGRAIEGIIALYRLYYSLLFAVDPRITGTYRWCVANIRRHAAGSGHGAG